MLKVYGASTFNATKVLFTAEEIGLDYEYVHFDFAKGEHKSAEHLARFPLGKVPAVEHNGNYLFESASICRYLSNISNKKLYSEVPVEAAKIDQMIDFVSHHAGRWLAVYFFQEVVMMKYYGKEADDKAIAEAKGFLDQQLPFLEKTLSENEFLCGKAISLADTVALPYFNACMSTSVALDAYPSIQRWVSAGIERPAFKRALAKMPQ